MSDPRERYRPHLEAIRSGVAEMARAEAGTRAGWWPEDRSWVPIFGRFLPNSDPYAVLAFQDATDDRVVCRVELSEERPGGDGNPDLLILQQDQVGWAAVARFPFDPRLPTLPAVLQQAESWAVARYRPHRRCTIRVDGADGRRFAKVFPDGRGATIHTALTALWRAQRAGELGFTTAAPIRFDAGRNTVWQTSVPGQPVSSTAEDGLDDRTAEAIGRALGSLHRSAVLAGVPAEETPDRADRHARTLGRLLPKLMPRAQRLRELLATTMDRGRAPSVRPIHGAFRINQLLEANGSLAFIDVDRLSVGHPESDAASFMVDVESRFGARQARMANDAFREGLEQVGGALDPARLRLYRATSALARALHAARSLDEGAEVKAERRLDAALEAIGGTRDDG